MSDQEQASSADDTGRIALLDPLVADQIAAGEVIERPASVVKELIENALDAEAHEIHVHLVDGGRAAITVRDDGFGMGTRDAALACRRHATSKLRAIDDLGRLESLGFRGEALASIAAVADVTITTRTRDAGEAVRVEVSGGQIRDVRPTGAPPGTTVEVRDLFHSVPARRSFLRRPQTELAHIVDLIDRTSLARAEVGFTCVHGSHETLRYAPVARSEERLRQVLGATRARQMIPVRHMQNGIEVRGFASRAGESFATGRTLLTYVRGRVVRDRLLTRAILDGYRALLPQRRFPAVVLEIELPASAVDVNVHPTKSEVRFSDGDAVFRAVAGALSSALAASEGGAETAIRVRAVAATATAGSASAFPGGGSRSWGAVDSGPRTEPLASLGVAESAPGYVARDAIEVLAPPPPRFASLRVVGQALGGYIVCEGDDGLVLIDQHAAHERVRFERLRAAGRSDSSVKSQRLLVARPVELDEASCAQLRDAEAALAAAGFEIESFGRRSVVLRALPADLDVSTDAEGLLAHLARDLAALETTDRLAAARDALYARLACHGAVRAGDPLEMAEMRHLVADLDTIPFAATCPHGRPLLAEISHAEVARRVRRR